MLAVALVNRGGAAQELSLLRSLLRVCSMDDLISPKAERILLALLLVLTGWALLPSLDGDFVADDYVFLVTSRMVDAPLTAFWRWHFYEPVYFRPVGLVVWWVTGRLFGLDYPWHAAFNAALHMGNVALLWMLLRAHLPGLWSRVVAVGWFALGPLSLGAVLWLSDRFDLLALAGLLVALLAASSRNRVVGGGIVFLASLAACWSKEWALCGCVAAALMMCVSSWRKSSRSGLWIGGAMLLAALLAGTVACVLRASVLDGAPAVVMSGFIRGSRMGDGLFAWFVGGWRIFLAVGAGWSVVAFGVVLGGAVVDLLGRHPQISRFDSGRRSRAYVAGAALVMFLALLAPQIVTVSGYLGLIDSGAFGVATTARFYYGSMAAFSGLVAALLSCERVAKVSSCVGVAVGLICVLANAGTSHQLAVDFSRWTKAEIAPIGAAATDVVEAVVSERGGPCVVVLLGTQVRSPYFRMFSDSTVKARTTAPERVWRCHVLTESTPWLFTFPALIEPLLLPLRPAPFIGAAPKPDSVWDSIRYRYRLPAPDMMALPDARYFDWRDGRFVEVTSAVRSGELRVGWSDW